ncbi:hypothetical protein HN873_055453, partial [Arachis hypogaea]
LEVLVSKITSNLIWPSLTLLISATLTPSPNNAAISLSQPVTTPPSNPSQHLHPSLLRRSCPTPPSPSLTRGANHQHHSSAQLISATRQWQPVSTNRHSASADVSGVYRKRSVASLSSLASDASLASANCEKAFSEVAAERVLDDMSLKSRGIRFPGRHNKSLAPIFTPPRLVSEVELDLPRQTQHDDIPVYPKAAESLAEPEEYPNLFEDWQVSLAVESKAAETRRPVSLKAIGWGGVKIEILSLCLRHVTRSHQDSQFQLLGCLSEMRSLKVDSQMIVSLQIILHSGSPRPPLKDLCDLLAHLQFWRGSSALKKKSCRLKVHFKQMLCRCPVHLPMREVQALAKEVAETVVLGH